MNIGGFEIERKFLIAMPDEGILKGLPRWDICQTYLIKEEKGGSERVRMRSRGDLTEYIHTVKRRISDISREENERLIDRAEYEELLQRADKGRRPIYKTRYILEHEGQDFEIDVYPFWTDRAIMELELTSEEQEIIMPPQIRIIREVTQDRRFTNAAMAKELPPQELLS